jgi:hypothetical protein
VRGFYGFVRARAGSEDWEKLFLRSRRAGCSGSLEVKGSCLKQVIICAGCPGSPRENLIVELAENPDAACISNEVTTP